MKDWPYKTVFNATANIISPCEEDKEKAVASLANLKDLIKVSEDEVSNNPDLLYLSADLFIGGIANNNNDAVTVEDAVAMAKQAPNKYLNLEHEEKQIVGALFSYGFREYTTERNFIDPQEDLKEVVVSVGGYIWRSVFPNLAEFLIEASDPASKHYGVASLSWEVYFKEYDIMVGSKNVAEAEIISDPEEVKKMTPFLKQKKGTGYYKGKPIYRLVKGPKLLLGAGIVRKPAADVKGVFTSETEESIKEKVADSVSEKMAANEDNFENKDLSSEANVIQIDKKEKNNKTKISHFKRVNVKRNIKAMKIKNLDDYKKVLASLTEGEEVDTKSLLALEANFDKVVASHAEEIRNEILAANKKYEDEIKEKQEAVIKAAEEKKEIQEKFEKLEAAKKEQEEELEKIKARLAEEEQTRLFNERMSALDSEYDLDEDARKVIASSIKSLDEESYDGWLNQFKILAKEKSKEYKKAKAEKEKEDAEKVKKAGGKKEEGGEKAKASEDTSDDTAKQEAEKAIAAAQKSATDTVPNSQHKEKISLAEELEGIEFELEK